VKHSTAIERIRYIERERVREQVSEDYHDELGTKLTKISLYTELVKRNVNGNASELMPLVNKIAESAESLSRDARDFIWALNPRKDTLYDVGVYLQDFGTSLFDESAVHFTVEGLTGELEQRPLSANWKRHLILIFKEGINNALKHATCGELRLRFEGQGDQLFLTLVDDGVGFDPRGLEAGSGDGLSNMRRRAAKLGGQLEIESGPGRGTVLRVRIP
jgi:signal transduction histidine kinase